VAFIDASNSGTLLDLPYTTRLGRDASGLLSISWGEDGEALAAGKVGGWEGAGWGHARVNLGAAQRRAAAGGGVARLLLLLLLVCVPKGAGGARSGRRARRGSCAACVTCADSPAGRAPGALCAVQGTAGGQAVCLAATADGGMMMYYYVPSGSADEEGSPICVPITAATYAFCKVGAAGARSACSARLGGLAWLWCWRCCWRDRRTIPQYHSTVGHSLAGSSPD
jgi:hypothetical protein